MKHSLSLLLVFLGINTAMSQDIFKQHGFTKEPLTLSQGKYKEFFENQTFVQIGSVILNTNTNEIVAFVKEDTAALVYQADLSSRWLCPDPLAEEYSDLSPYNYCADNPIRFIDPNGMYIDDYGVDNNGNITKLRDTDDNYDVLYAVKKDENGKLVEVDLNKDGKISEKDGQKVEDRNVLPELSENKSDYNGSYASSKSLNDIGNVFLFAATNSNVEWSFSAFNKNGSSDYVVSTSHKTSSVSRIANLPQFNEKDLTYSLHSHPGIDGTKGASYTGGVIRGDWDNVRDFYNRWTASGNNPLKFPVHGIYHQNTKTIYYYTPWVQSIKGHTFKRK